MLWLLAIISGLAAFHFVYEGIVVPSVRYRLRFRLFELRDSLRQLRLERGEDLSESLFLHQHDLINNTIAVLPRLTISAVLAAKSAVDQDPVLARRTEARRREIEECELEEFQRIFRATRETWMLAFVVNAGGWLIFLIPIAVVFASIRRIWEVFNGLLFLSERDLDRLVPAE